MNYEIDNKYPSEFQELNNYTRSIESTGWDLDLEIQDDLRVLNDGDLDVVKGIDLIRRHLLRRLNTPPYGYRKWVRTINGMEELDVEYGNPLYRFLSSSKLIENFPQIRSQLIDYLNGDPYITVTNVIFLSRSNSSNPYIDLEVHYVVKSNKELNSLVLHIEQMN